MARQIAPGAPESLDRRSREQDVGSPAPKSDAADVVNDGAAGARHHADDSRLGRKRTLSFLCEETLRGEFDLESFERFEQGAATSRLPAIGDELKSSARSPQRRPASESHARPVRTEVPQARSDVGPVHDHIHGRVFALVLQSKVEVPAGRGAQARHLTFNPHRRGEGPVERVLDRSIQRRDAQRMFGIRGQTEWRFAWPRASARDRGRVARIGHPPRARSEIER